MAETHPGTNGFDPAKVRSFVERIENIENDIASEKGAYMQTCGELRRDIKSVLDEAKDDGIPKKELKRVIRVRALERKAEEARAELEGDEQHNFDMIRHALGDLADLPLGKAALGEQVDLEESIAGAAA